MVDEDIQTIKVENIRICWPALCYSFPVLVRVLTEHHAMEAHWRSGGIAPFIF